MVKYLSSEIAEVLGLNQLPEEDITKTTKVSLLLPVVD